MSDQGKVYAKLVDGKWWLPQGAFTLKDDAGVEYDFADNWLAKSTPAQRKAWGFQEVERPDPPPEGVDQTGYELINFKGRPKWKVLFEKVPVEAAQARALNVIGAQRSAEHAAFRYDGVDANPEDLLQAAAARLTMRRELEIEPGQKFAFRLADGEYRMLDHAGELAVARAVFEHLAGVDDNEAKIVAKVLEAKTPAAVLKLIGPATAIPA